MFYFTDIKQFNILHRLYLTASNDTFRGISRHFSFWQIYTSCSHASQSSFINLNYAMPGWEPNNLIREKMKRNEETDRRIGRWTDRWFIQEWPLTFSPMFILPFLFFPTHQLSLILIVLFFFPVIHLFCTSPPHVPWSACISQFPTAIRIYEKLFMDAHQQIAAYLALSSAHHQIWPYLPMRHCSPSDKPLFLFHTLTRDTWQHQIWFYCNVVNFMREW